MAIALWSISFYLSWRFARRCFPVISPYLAQMRAGRSVTFQLEAAERVLHDLHETLEAGCLTSDALWARVDRLDVTLRELIRSSVETLRLAGAPVVPTLKRFRRWCLRQRDALEDARTRTTVALSQACVVTALVPLASVALYSLLEPLRELRGMWILMTLAAWGWSLAGAASIFSLALKARWGGLAAPDRPFVLEWFGFVEAVLAQVAGGAPGDLAWTRVRERMRGFASDAFLSRVGPHPWAEPGRPRDWLTEFVEGAERAVQASLLEGRPVGERLAALALAFETEFATRVDRAVEALAVQALRPLYVYAFPAIGGLIAFALWQVAAHDLSVL